MRPMPFRRSGALAMACALAVAAGATPNAEPDATPTPREQLSRILADLSQRHSATLLLDPEAEPGRAPRAPEAGLSFPDALRALVTSTRDVAWRRVYLPIQRKSTPPVEELAAAASALGGVAIKTMVMEIGGSKRALRIRKERAVTERLATELAESGLETRPIDLLYSTTGARDGQTTARRAKSLERTQVALPTREEHLAFAMTQVMRLLQEMPPEPRELFMRSSVKASDEAWEATPPARRQEMMRQSMDLARRYDPAARGPVAATGPGAEVAAGTKSSVRPPLSRAVTRLGARFGAMILIDPALAAEALPARLDPEWDLPAALARVAAALPGVAWARVYLTEEQRERLRRAGERAALIEAARTLARLDSDSVAVEDTEARRVTFFRSSEKIDAGEREASGCDARPIYLIYARDPAAPGATPEERLAHLQREQFSLLTRMPSAQLARSMTAWARAYETADAATRARILGLPVMAGMMAGWFPREALERKQRGEP